MRAILRVVFVVALLLLLRIPSVFAAPVVRHVCVRTPDAEVAKLGKWFYIKGPKGPQRVPPAQFDQLLSQAEVLYVFDPKAPATSVKYLPAPFNATLACPGHKPLGEAAKRGASTSGGGAAGPKVSTWEELIRQVSIGASILSGDVSGSLSHPQGSTSGIPSGKNVGAFSFPPLQLGVSIVQIITSVGMTPKSFTDDVMRFAKQGQRTVIKDLDQAALKVADELLEKYGRAMAPALRDMQTIMPYAMAEKFTKGFGGKFQAHKIFEKRAFGHFKMDGVEKAPAIIIDKELHEQISIELAHRWKKKPPDGLGDLHAMYKEVYRNYPHWLAAIEHYFPK